MQSIKYFDFQGKEIFSPTKDVCAKSIFHVSTGRTTYYVKVKNGIVYNPDDDLDKRKIITNRYLFKKVNEDCFKLYLSYLNINCKGGRRRTLLTQIQRKL